jgi:hypothetical protein
VPEAKHLDIILYSREQLLQEYKALPTKAAAAAVGPADDESLLPNVPWGIISVKAQVNAGVACFPTAGHACTFLWGSRSILKSNNCIHVCWGTDEHPLPY